MTWSRLRNRGSVAIMVGLLAVPLIAMTGAAIDLTRIWLVKSRLQMSLDAAVLVVAHDLATGGTSVDGVNLFWANFGRISGTSTVGYLQATATAPVVHNPAPGGPSSSVQLTSSATIQPAFVGIIGIGPVTVGGASTAQSAAYGLELSLVLDNTGSMAGSSITSLITAANQLLTVVYGGSDTQPNLWVAVVPFAATLNVGSTHTSWLVGATINQTLYAPSKWMGCVMARTAKTGAKDGDDFNDKPPAQAALQPFLYASTYHVYPTAAGIKYGSGNKLTYWYPGDNDWTVSPNNIQEPDQSNNSVGPNLACPSLAILPETASKTAVAAVINKMLPVYRGGTIISLGLQAG
jgi:Flp pilus assembly protein TadG